MMFKINDNIKYKIYEGSISIVFMLNPNHDD